jgi:hypothetical protein
MTNNLLLADANNIPNGIRKIPNMVLLMQGMSYPRSKNGYDESAVIKVRTIAKMNEVIQNKNTTRRMRLRGTDTLGLSDLSEKIICPAPVVFERIIFEP